CRWSWIRATPPGGATGSPRCRWRPRRRAPTGSSWRSTRSPRRRSATARRPSWPTSSRSTCGSSRQRPLWPARNSPGSDARMRVAVIGVGLIGGSIGLAAREHLPDAEVAGFDAEPGVLEAARELGAVDLAAGSVAEALEGAAACFLCAPVGALPGLLQEALAA